MSTPESCLFIKLPARTENLAVVRHAVSNVARQHGMNESRVADLQIVVTEACSNVVVHAYRDRPLGPIEVEVACEAEDDELALVVRDRGAGFQASAVSDRQSLRLGLALISTLSRSFDVSRREGAGTEVSVLLPLLAAS
jgi:serine/threonine-protein kinase RsbW